MIIYADNYGSADNFSVPLQKAISDLQAGDELHFTKSEYHFFRDFSSSKEIHMTNTDSFQNPIKYFAIWLSRLQHITIDGHGTVFHIHGDMCAFSLLQCSDITLKNFTVHYPSPSNVEFTVKEIREDAVVYRLSTNHFEINGKSITFFETSPFSDERYFEFTDNEMTDCWVCHNGSEVERVWNENSPLANVKDLQRISPNVIEVSYHVRPDIMHNAVYAISPNHNRHTCGAFFSECSNILSENITVNYLAGFGWLSQMCENLTFAKIRFIPAEGFHASSFADCIHICGCKGNVKINGCVFTHSHDDAINIHGTFLRTKEILNDRSAVLEFAHHQQGGYMPFDIGDQVKFYNRRNLSVIGGAYTVKAIREEIEKRTVTLEFEEALPPLEERMSVIENMTYNPQVVISDCQFDAIPTRAILCTTDQRAEIYNNTFAHIKMADIYISCDCNEWYESGPCKDMRIYHNIFSKKNAVVVEPVCMGTPVDNVHENIRIYDNSVKEQNDNEIGK